MTPRRILLPDDLPEAFLRTAGVHAGVSEWALRSPRFERPFHGVRTAVGLPDPPSRDQHLVAARSYLPRLRPSEVFSHHTALRLHGCPIRIGRSLHLSVQTPRNASRARGVVGHQHAHPCATMLVDRNLPVAAPAPALLQAASSLPLAELVVAIDHLIRPQPSAGNAAAPLTLAELEHCAQSPRTRGSSRLREAARLARVGAESRMETLVRLILVAFDIAEGFELQVSLRDDAGWIGRFDLVHRARRVVVEYDGEQHRTDALQYARDERRVSRAWGAGYRVLRFRYPEVVADPPAVAQQVADALGTKVSSQPHTDLLTWS